MAKTDDTAKISHQKNRKIFVTDLHKSFTPKQVREYFSKYGLVTDVTILEPSRNSAFVTFDTSDASQSVLNQKCEHHIKGSLYPVRAYEAISEPTDNHESQSNNAIRNNVSDAQLGSTTLKYDVLIERLPRTTTLKDIRSWFSKYGTIIDVLHPLPTRQVVGVAFETPRMAQALMEQEGKLRINGALIQLTLWGADHSVIHERSVEFSTQTNSIARMHNGCDPADLSDGMRDTLRLIKFLAPARGYASSMVSLYLNNGDSTPDDSSVNLLIDKLEREYQQTSDRDFPWADESHEGSNSEPGQRYGPSSRNLAATQESIKTIKMRLQLNGATSTRGRVIFCGTVFAEAGETRQVLIEFEPYTLISDKSFCFFDNKFHLGPLAFKLINYQMSDALGASDFKKVAEATGDDLEKNLASFTIEDSSNYEHSDPILLGKEDLFLFGKRNCYCDILREVRVAETTRILRLMESLRVSGDENAKKIILIVEATQAPRVSEFLNSTPDLNEAKDPTEGSMLDFDYSPEWLNAAEKLLKVGSFPGDLSAKRCFEFAEERLNSYSQQDTRKGLIIYCELGMSVGGREMKFSVEIEPRRPVRKNRVIYIPNGSYDLKPLEELVLLEDDLVPFALDPKNAPQGIMSHEKRDLLIRLVEELASEPIIAQPPRAPASWPIVSATRRLAKKARGVFKRMFNRSSQPDNDSSMFECAQL